MSMFERNEAFDIVSNILQIENAEKRMVTDRRALLDEIIFKIESCIPFQSIILLSQPPEQRRKPTREEMKSNFISGIGGLCFDTNITAFELLSALGFDVSMALTTVTHYVSFPNNHVVLIINGLEKTGDQFFVDVATGFPTFQAINLDFEEETPVFINSFLEYKFVKHEGKIMRMHRKGDSLATKGPQNDSKSDFWLGDWRRFYSTDLACTKDLSEISKRHDTVYENPESTAFHKSQRIMLYTNGKLHCVANDRLLNEDDKGEVITTTLNGDEEIFKAIKAVCPPIPDEMLRKSIKHWRQTTS